MADRTRIRIWHPYAVDLVRPGARKPERKMATAPIDIDVRTVSASELTVASKFRPSTRHSMWKGEFDGGPEVVLHGFDGSLWEPLPGPDGPAGATLAQWQASMAGGPPLPVERQTLDPILAAQYGTPSGFVSEWGGTIRLDEITGKVIADNQQLGAESAIRAADSVLLVDGRVWRKVTPPFWSIEREGSVNAIYLRWNRTVGLGLWLSEGCDLLGTFSADQLDEAMTYVRECAASRGRRAEIRGPGGACLVHDSRHAARDDRLEDALLLGGPVMDALGVLVKSMSTVGIEAYAEARVLMARLAVGDGDGDTVSALVAAFTAAAADLDRFDAPRLSVPARDEMKRTCLAALTSRLAKFTPSVTASLHTPPSL